jgi:uncharacterized protein (TIGR02996 family)
MQTENVNLDPGLLRSVLQSPQDDSARLVAADWLEEHGESEHAEFIRLQLELAKLGPCVDHCRDRIDWQCDICDVRYREREMFRQNVGFKVAANLKGHLPESFEFSRGFVSLVRCTCDRWKNHGVEICLSQPIERLILDPVLNESHEPWGTWPWDDPDYQRPEDEPPGTEPYSRLALSWARTAAGLPPIPADRRKQGVKA